jgi:hypothetical protein
VHLDKSKSSEPRRQEKKRVNISILVLQLDHK